MDYSCSREINMFRYFEVVMTKKEIKDENDFIVFYVRCYQELSPEKVLQILHIKYPDDTLDFDRVDSVQEVDPSEAFANTNCRECDFFTI